MEEKNSKDMDVSYGVDSDSESAKEITKKTTKTSKKTKKSKASEEKAPEKKPSLISEIEQMKANNEVKSEEFSKKMEELENVLGINEISPFGTNELDVFERKIKGMSLSDMRSMAAKVGINPFHEKATLKTMLVKEFKASNRNNMRNVMPSPQETIKLDPNNPKHAKTIEILGDI